MFGNWFVCLKQKSYKVGSGKYISNLGRCGKKINWVGLGKCMLCKCSEKIMGHMFVTCPFSIIVLYEVIQVNVGKTKWHKLILTSYLLVWIAYKIIVVYRVVPWLFAYGVRLTRN